MRTLIAVGLCAVMPCVAAADDPVFSGPQVGELLPSLPARYAFGPRAGEDFDLPAEAAGKPLCIVLVHKRTRPSIHLTRVVINYATSKVNEGLTSGVVFLTPDATETESWLKRVRNSPALPRRVPLGISPDGEEGPGSYGLNRAMTLTVLVGNEGKVTANFPLIQPGVATDAPKIAAAIAAAMGRDDKPTLADLGVGKDGRAMRRDGGKFRAALAPVIQKGATPEEVDAAAERVERLAAADQSFRARVAQVSNRIIDAGRLENYGTPHAQAYLQKWAKEFRDSVPQGVPPKPDSD